MEIAAAVSRTPGADFSIETVELDDPRDDEILVRIVGVGVCHTDIVARDGGFGFSMPAVLGHEGSGVVQAVGSAVSKVKPGDRVALSFRSCGDCQRCNRGEPAYCHTMPALNYTGMRTDGSRAIRAGKQEIISNFFGQSSFATYALTYERNVVKVPDEAPLELMGPLGCGVQTGAGGVMRSLACEEGSTLLITGGGAVGLSAVMGAKIQGCAIIIVSEPHAGRRALALELGATHVIDPKQQADLPTAVRAIVSIGVDYALDTTGLPAIQRMIMDCLGPHGTLGVVGIPPPDAPLPGQMLKAMTFGHSVKGIIEGDSDPDEFIPVLIDHFLHGRLPFDRMIRRYPLSEINRAVLEQHRGECIKAVLLTDPPMANSAGSRA